MNNTGLLTHSAICPIPKTTWYRSIADDHKDNSMKWLALSGLLLASCCCTLEADDPYRADSYYSGNHWSPYPPSCVTVPLRQLDLYGDNVALIYDGTINLEVVNKISGPDSERNLTPVPMKMFRIACAEEDRSVILVEFRLASSNNDLRANQIELPDFVGSTGMHGFPLILNPEPNIHGQSLEHRTLSRRTFGDYTGGWSDPGSFSWRFILDVSPLGHYWGPWVSEYYNGSFGLEIMLSEDFGHQSVMVPSTRSVLSRNPQLPLNGRLSGNWVEPGTRDQGFLLSVSTQADSSLADGQPENSDLLVFLAWYTFDSNGQMLWLTASASAPQGSTNVDLQFVRVDNGQFLGERPAERSLVGSGQLKAGNCNKLELDYDLTELGLGQGSMELSRIFALEIAGYHCRDYQARLESLYGKESN
jgi:hypothetical protein